MKKYSLRNKKTKELIGFTVSSNDGAEFASAVAYELSEGQENVWLVDNPRHAEFVRLNSTGWFIAGYDTPSHSLKPEEWEVVEIEMAPKKIDVKIPSHMEIFEILYKNEPAHLEGLKRRIKEGAKFSPSWYDYQRALGKFELGGMLNKKFTFKQLFK